jgi:hypothetical protein
MKETFVCSICHLEYFGYGNNARPINSGRCCDSCNALEVIPERVARLQAGAPMRAPKETFN